MYIKIPKDLITESKCKASYLKVYAVLEEYYMTKGPNCDYTNFEIMKLARIQSTATLNDAIQFLEKRNFIRRSNYGATRYISKGWISYPAGTTSGSM